MIFRTMRIAAPLPGVVFTALLVMALFPVSTALAQQPGQITEYGIYSKDHKLLEQTSIIPAGGAVRFGFCFEADIDFFDDDSYMLVEALAHPPVPGKEGGQNSGYSVPRLFKVSDGVASGCSGYRARDAADLRPGVWRFTISDGPQVLVVKEFTVK